ncbi:MAG: M23 family metallopeptidase [Muribaculaceae bacterium]|nr:M23 family metallopeptidase [Muribaculaceae bacterium]
MEKKALYTYNPETDDFERYYPSIKDRLRSVMIYGGLSLLFGGAIFVGVYFGLADRSEVRLREENARLRSKYTVLEHRVETSMKVMDKIRNRDDNFYRVMMQMDPMSLSRRYAGFDFESNYEALSTLSDKALVERLTSKLDLLDRQLYSQSQSFDQLRSSASDQEEKMNHIPGILPIHESQASLSGGFGLRRDPLQGERKFHSGLDFQVDEGTPIIATANGTVTTAGRQGNYGNIIELSHGYNYVTRYAHLSRIAVEEGTEVKRGDVIGYAGSTGKSTAPHLHYEVRFKGEAQNPVNYFFLDLTPQQYGEMLQSADDAGQVLD